jgi:hypothetical protein
MAKASVSSPGGARKKVPYKVLQVTFDLWGTKPGDARYRMADDALQMHGQLFKPIKQVRFLITKKSSALILRSLDQQIGKRTSIFITELRNIRQIRLGNSSKQEEWDLFEEALAEAGISLPGSSSP